MGGRSKDESCVVEALFQARETAPHPGFDRAERLSEVKRDLGMAQALIER
jgi:hypothetical protein